MQDDNTQDSLPKIFAMLRRHLLLVVLTTALAIGVSLGLSAATDPMYQASAQIGYNDESGDVALGIQASPSFTPDKDVAAQAERITRPAAIDAVIKRLKLKLTPAQVQGQVDTRVEVASNLVSINAKASSAELAADLANTFARQTRKDERDAERGRYRSVARTAQDRAARLKGDKNAARRATYQDQAARLLTLAQFVRPVDLVRSARVPGSPSSPKPLRNAVLAGLLGIMLGIGLALLRQTFDRRLREPADVELEINAPVLGHLQTRALGRTPWTRGRRQTRAKPEDLEPYRILRTNLSLAAAGADARRILVTSPLASEGKSTVSIGLAWAEAMTGRRTLLVDCDLRRPSVAERLGLPESPGLADFLLGRAQPAEILHPVRLDGVPGDDQQTLVCIPAGKHVDNHAELLESERFRTFLAQVSEAYDRVIIDSAPILPVSDTLALLPQADSVLACFRLGQTTRQDCRAAGAALERASVKSLGLVITAADESGSAYYGGSYAYAASYATD